MNSALQVLLANIPTMVCAIVGGVLADHGHPWFAAELLVLAFVLAHGIDWQKPL